MKRFTDKELAEAVKTLTRQLTDSSCLELNDIIIIKNGDSEVLFEVTAMYEKPFKFNHSVYEAFVNLFDTFNVDFYEDITVGGCETCDYWSQYGYAIRVWA